MTKREIKQYFLSLEEESKQDFYNSIVCRFGSSDDMIHLNNSEFFETQFLNLSDIEQSKSDNSYIDKDKYIKMIEYKKLETSTNIMKLIDLKILIDVTRENIAEVLQMGLIQNNVNKSKISDFNSKSIHTHQQDGESSKNVNKVRLKRQFDGRGEVKGFRFNQIARNDFAVIYEKVYGSYIKKTFEVFEIKVNTKFNIESYPKSKSFGYWAWEIDTLENAVHKFHEITKRVKERKRERPTSTHTHV
ncbi:hypothetical protein SAMN05443634_10886 [Chishuiella changwenlii]|uniref:Uncharacterized protein n=1 Tax=Chishuiella changwenlii TaxID=1434701 RepID=A0A1M6ZXQ7_9FLAO|nr:hypothetical protein [Chishuiella changwenlii]GGE92246.1 hypothetical protein GCM10010984_07400 [Chishuiella changwenlii]SHL35125.1 hypothetical protein SAMN05443634_10886 [Chishuiella changwenlii]